MKATGPKLLSELSAKKTAGLKKVVKNNDPDPEPVAAYMPLLVHRTRAWSMRKASRRP